MLVMLPIRPAPVPQIHTQAIAMAPAKYAQKAATHEARTLGIAGNKLARQRQRTQITPAAVASVNIRSPSRAGPIWLALRSAPVVKEAQEVVTTGMTSNATSENNEGSPIWAVARRSQATNAMVASAKTYSGQTISAI